MNITRKNASKWYVNIPMIVGPMALGHRFNNGSLNTHDLNMWELVPDYGGWNNSWTQAGRYNQYSSGLFRSTPTPGTYPDGAFSPVNVMADSNLAVGFAALGVIDPSTSISFQQSVPNTRYNPAFRGGIATTLSNASVVVTLAVTVATAGEGWQSTLQPYKTYVTVYCSPLTVVA